MDICQLEKKINLEKFKFDIRSFEVPMRFEMNEKLQIPDLSMPMFLGVMPGEAKEARRAPSSLSPPSCVLK